MSDQQERFNDIANGRDSEPTPPALPPEVEALTVSEQGVLNRYLSAVKRLDAALLGIRDKDDIIRHICAYTTIHGRIIGNYRAHLVQQAARVKELEHDVRTLETSGARVEGPAERRGRIAGLEWALGGCSELRQRDGDYSIVITADEIETELARLRRPRARHHPPKPSVAPGAPQGPPVKANVAYGPYGYPPGQLAETLARLYPIVERDGHLISGSRDGLQLLERDFVRAGSMNTDEKTGKVNFTTKNTMMAYAADLYGKWPDWAGDAITRSWEYTLVLFKMLESDGHVTLTVPTWDLATKARKNVQVTYSIPFYTPALPEPKAAVDEPPGEPAFDPESIPF